MNRGIVYLFCALPAAERLVVSLWSLRKFCAHPVTIYATEECHAHARLIAASFDAAVDVLPDGPAVRHGHYLMKPWLAARSPYARSLFIDADTLIVGSLDPLWSETTPLVLTSYGNWVTTGHRITGRCHWFADRSPSVDRLIQLATSKTFPCLNTGVLLWDKGLPELETWATLTEIGLGFDAAGAHKWRPSHMTDEIAMQLMIAGMTPERYRVLDDRWNCSPIHGAHKEEAQIWHFHGQKHLRKDQGRALWEPAFRACWAENPAGLRDWAGRFDKFGVKELVEELRRAD